MASTAAERKAEETKRKAEQGLKRRSFWLTDETMKMIEKYKSDNGLKTNDEAVNDLIIFASNDKCQN